MSSKITKEGIHIYVIEPAYNSQNRNLPLTFHLSTDYADGSPARCKKNVKLGTGTSFRTRCLTLRSEQQSLSPGSPIKLQPFDKELSHV